MDLWIVFEILVNIFQSGLIVYFLRGMLVSQRKHLAADIVCTALLALFLTSYLFWDVPVIDTLGFGIPLVYALIVYDEKWYKPLFWTAVAALIIIGVGSLTSSIYLHVYPSAEFLQRGPTRIAFVLSSNMVMLTTMTLIIKISKKKSAQPSWQSTCMLLVLNLLFLLAIELLFTAGMKGQLPDTFIGICICLFLASVLSIALYEIMRAHAQKQHDYELEIENLRLTRRHLTEAKALYNMLSEMRHDIHHHRQMIGQLISEHDLNAAEKYVAQWDTQLEETKFISTGNIAADALITAKQKAMLQDGIVLQLQPYPLAELPISESTFCTVLGNLIDNAHEAVLRISNPSGEDRTVQLIFARSWDMLHITCINSFDESTLHMKGTHFLSSKRSEQHGLGLRSIRSSVEKAQGNASFSAKDGIFTAKIILPYASF